MRRPTGFVPATIAVSTLILVPAVLVGAGSRRDDQPREHAVLWIGAQACMFQAASMATHARGAEEYAEIARSLHLQGEAPTTAIGFWDAMDANGWDTISAHPGSGEWAGFCQVVLER